MDKVNSWREEKLPYYVFYSKCNLALSEHYFNKGEKQKSKFYLEGAESALVRGLEHVVETPYAKAFRELVTKEDKYTLENKIELVNLLFEYYELAEKNNYKSTFLPEKIDINIDVPLPLIMNKDDMYQA